MGDAQYFGFSTSGRIFAAMAVTEHDWGETAGSNFEGRRGWSMG